MRGWAQMVMGRQSSIKTRRRRIATTVTFSAWRQHVHTMQWARTQAGERAQRSQAGVAAFYLTRWTARRPQRKALECLFATHDSDLLHVFMDAWHLFTTAINDKDRFFKTGSRGIFGEGLKEQRVWALQHRLYQDFQRNHVVTWREEVVASKMPPRRRGFFDCFS